MKVTKKNKEIKKDNLENLNDFEENCECEEECCCDDCCEHGENKKSHKNCGCKGECSCPPECGCHRGEECTCDSKCSCRDKEGHCTCGDDCKCESECSCESEVEEKKESNQKQSLEAEEYLAMAQRLQADFDNYRRRVAEQLEHERQEGARSVIEVFLPCLDSFKEAKKSVTDENILTGINMIENKILDALNSLKVEKINSIGQHFDPHLHNVIAVFKDESKENDTILEEYQSGWTMNGKVIRYAKVVVNKL